MTQEEKDLLLKDLCARSPYGVKVEIIKNYQLGIYTLYPSDIDSFKHNFKDIKPYLRPMSSMTEEEKVEYCDLQDNFLLSSQYPVTDGHALFDWLDKKMFDYRGLIPTSLALEAPEGMYS